MARIPLDMRGLIVGATSQLRHNVCMATSVTLLESLVLVLRVIRWHESPPVRRHTAGSQDPGSSASTMCYILILCVS